MIKNIISYILVFCLRMFSVLVNVFFSIIRIVIYVLIYKVIQYRVTTVRINLMTAFRDKSSYELKQIEKKFYKYFSYLVTQIIQSYSFSAKQVKKYIWLHHDAKQLLWELEKTDKPIFVVTSHYGNWELSVLLTALETKYQTYGIYQKLNNHVLDEFVKQNRAKFGIQLVETKFIRNNFSDLDKKRSMFCFIADQTPVIIEKSSQVNFFGIETPFYNGYAQMAQQANAIILYATIQPIDNTHFEIKLKEITLNAAEETLEKIVGIFANYLEQDIQNQPAYWLWTHRRWKRAGIEYYENNR